MLKECRTRTRSSALESVSEAAAAHNAWMKDLETAFGRPDQNPMVGRLLGRLPMTSCTSCLFGRLEEVRPQPSGAPGSSAEAEI